MFLTKIDNEKLFIPSCESRLKLVRGGSIGGKNSKPTSKPNSKPTSKPFESLDEKNEKPIVKQRETKIETKDKVKEIKIEDVKVDGYQSHPTIKAPLSN